MAVEHDKGKMELLEGSYSGSVLIVLGGLSGSGWESLLDKHPGSYIVGVNGVSTVMSEHLDFFLWLECLPRGWQHKYPGLFSCQPETLKFVNCNRVNLVSDQENVIAVRRGGCLISSNDKRTTWRPWHYDKGLVTGEPNNPFGILRSGQTLGTSALQALHLAAFLGFTDIHTIGLDLCFKGKHHWYEYPDYTPENSYWDGRNFMQYKGLDTQYFWVESAKVLLRAKKILSTYLIDWTDHSDGLLQRMTS